MRNYYVYRQKEYARNILLNGFQSDHVQFELKLLAVYLRDEFEMKPLGIKKRLTRFCQQYGQGYTLRGWCMLTKKAVSYAANGDHALMQCDYVPIYRSELEYIESLYDKGLGEDVQRTVLAIMIHKKLDKASFEARHDDAYSIFSYKPYSKRGMSLPRVAGLKRRRGFDFALDVLHPMYEQGLVEEIRASSSPLKLNFADKIVFDGEEVLRITDYENIGLYYDYLYHGGIGLCGVCGAPFKYKAKGLKRKWCDEHSDGKKKTNNVMMKCERCGDVFGALPQNAGKQRFCYHCQGH